MAARIRIECINKHPRQDPHKHIANVGGRNPDGSSWKLSEERAIEGMQAGKWEFYVHVGSHTVEVIIARSAAGNDYLKTEADGYRPDNLLSLPECP